MGSPRNNAIAQGSPLDSHVKQPSVSLSGSRCLAKARFWQTHAGTRFNERQCAMVDGKLITIAKRVATKDTAGGRSTSYSRIGD